MLTRNVWILALVSLFADVASEMLYPVMPVYLKGIGFSMALIGLLEGLAEAVAGLAKGYFGAMSDRRGERVPFVRGGYLASAISKPLMVASAWPLWIFGARTLDRLGKGLRSGARDALLSDEATPQTKGRVFGFHRSMDTVGAVAGPLLALAYLHFFPGDYRTLFLLAIGPGLISVGLTFFIREKKRAADAAKPSVARRGLFDFLKYWKISPPAYRTLAGGLLAFALFNSSDAFLLLKMKNAGMDDAQVIGAYIFYNIVFAAGAYPMGILADRWGKRPVFLVGLGLFAATYAGFALNDDWAVFYVLLLLYGLYAAATDGVAKAWISNICKKEDTATAIGTYAGLQSIAALLASSMAGLLWQWGGPALPFALSSVAALGAMLFLAFGAKK